MTLYWIIFIGTALISWIVQANLTSKFKRYSKVQLPNRMTGADIARKMLEDNGITDVNIISTAGQLTDHYNPANKTINLSENVYSGNSIMSAAVAAHECGHAIQHACEYAPLRMRSALVPVVDFASKWVMWLILGGLFLVNQLGSTLLLAGIILFALTTLFSFITLPVEIDASRRALVWLSNAGITTYETHEMSEKALRAAAYTYVVAALGSLATLLYYIMIFMGRRD